MKRNVPAFLGLALGLAALGGCIQTPPPAPCLAFTTPPPPPAAILVPPAPVWTPPPRHVVLLHPVHRVVAVRHRWVHKYVARVSPGPYCGSVPHPCNVEHLTVPVQ